MSRKKKDHDKERDQIAVAAHKSILKLGLHKCSLKDIADEAGFTVGKLMYYFRDKESLIFYAKNRLFDEVWERSRQIADEHEGIDKLVAVAMSEIALTPAGVHRERLLAVFKALALSSEKARQKQVRRDAKGWGHLQEIIEELQDQNVIDDSVDSELAAFGIIAFVEGISSHLIMAPKLQGVESIREIVTRHIHAMVGSKEVSTEQ